MGCETFYCSCGQDFDERPLLEVHKQKCPALEEVCQVNASTNHDLKENKPPLVDQIKCDKCDKIFRTKKCLRQHFYNLHPKPQQLGQFECDMCDAVFERIQALRGDKVTKPMKERAAPPIVALILLSSSSARGPKGKSELPYQ